MSDRSSSSGGIGFVGLLTIVFIVLKLCDVINWTWWWVLAPIWITTAVCFILLACLLVGALVVHWNGRMR